MEENIERPVRGAAFHAEGEWAVPEGYEAEIKDGKIIVRKKESEDERNRRQIIDILLHGDTTAYDHEALAAWVEKQKDSKWSPSEDEMGVLYKLCYISNQVTDEDDTELTRLYQDLKREYFNGHSFENMFPSEKQKEQKSIDYPYLPGWRKNYDGNKPELKHSVLMLTTHGVAEGEWLGEKWCQYRWSCELKDGEVLYWMHLSDLEQLEKEGEEKQKEQKPAERSEEDERVRTQLLDFLENLHSQGATMDFDVWSKADCANWIAYLEKQKEKSEKPIISGWSEEDKETMQELIDLLWIIQGSSNIKPGTASKYTQWLKSLRPGKPEWTGNDSMALVSLEAIINNSNHDEARKKELLDWLLTRVQNGFSHTPEEKEFVRTIKSLVADFIYQKEGVDTSYYQRLVDWVEKRHIESIEPLWTPTEAQMWALQEAVTRSCSSEYGGPLSEMLEMLNRSLGRKTAWEKCKPGATDDNAVAFVYPSPEAWRFANEGTKFSEDMLVVGADREPRISRCAVNKCYYLPTSKILPPKSVTDKLVAQYGESHGEPAPDNQNKDKNT